MKKINLRDLFPEYHLDCFIEVPDEDVGAFISQITKVEAEVFMEFERSKNAYLRDLYRNKAHYSLNQDDGIENLALFLTYSPDEIFECKSNIELLYAAIANLPYKQANRVYAHYILGMSKSQIAQIEGVHKSQITRSLHKALISMKNFLKNSL